MKYVTTESGRVSRMQIVSAASAALGAAVVVLPEVRDALDPEMYGYLFLGLSVVNAVLRVLTSEPVKR